MFDLDMQHQLFPLVTAFVTCIGACVGSFLNVVVYRLPRGESLVSPPSHCPACNHPIPPLMNVPVLAWLFLRGRCHFCRAPISVRYPLVEFFTALLFLAAWLAVYHDGLPWIGLARHLVLLAALLAVSLTDIDSRFVPDAVTFPAMAWALLSAALIPAAVFFPGGVADGGIPGGLITTGIAALVVEPFGLVLGDRSRAVLEAVTGLATGIVLLWAFRVVSQRIWGERTRRAANPVSFSLTPERLRFGEQHNGPLADFLPASFEAVELVAENVRLRRRGESADTLLPGKVAVSLSSEEVRVGEQHLPSAEVQGLEGQTAAWTFSRDVLGWGDIKLLGMCGAFLGPDACLFVVTLGALAASLAGIGILAVRRQGGIMLPFAPFLAAAAAVWFFFGKDLVLFYGRVILGLYSSEMPL